MLDFLLDEPSPDNGTDIEPLAVNIYDDPEMLDFSEEEDLPESTNNYYESMRPGLRNNPPFTIAHGGPFNPNVPQTGRVETDIGEWLRQRGVPEAIAGIYGTLDAFKQSPGNIFPEKYGYGPGGGFHAGETMRPSGETYKVGSWPFEVKEYPKLRSAHGITLEDFVNREYPDKDFERIAAHEATHVYDSRNRITNDNPYGVKNPREAFRQAILEGIDENPTVMQDLLHDVNAGGAPIRNLDRLRDPSFEKYVDWGHILTAARDRGLTLDQLPSSLQSIFRDIIR